MQLITIQVPETKEEMKEWTRAVLDVDALSRWIGNTDRESEQKDHITEKVATRINGIIELCGGNAKLLPKICEYWGLFDLVSEVVEEERERFLARY